MNLREKAASFFIACEPSQVKKQLALLDNAENTIPDEVLIWEKFEDEPLEDLMSHIHHLELILKDVWDEAQNNF
jgi:hypothetical protein